MDKVFPMHESIYSWRGRGLALAAVGLLIGLPASGETAEKRGEEVYQQTCIVCHGSGLLGAPRLSDGKRWRKLVSEGLDDLVPAALGGIRQMPARGGNPNLSDADVARAVVWMVNQHGAQAVEPDEAAVARWRRLADRHKK
jgi:cytochrome c5